MDGQQAIRAVGCAVALAFLGVLYTFYDLPLLIASFGSTAITLFALPKAPAAKPYNTVVGQFSAAIIGWLSQFALGTTWYACAVAVTVSMLVMVVLNCVHPPGGATALTAVLTPQDWTFVFAPILVGVLFLVAVAYVTNKACDKVADNGKVNG